MLNFQVIIGNYIFYFLNQQFCIVFCFVTNYDNNGNQISKVRSAVIVDEASLSNPYLKIMTDAEFKAEYKNRSNPRTEYFKYDVFNQLTGYSNSKGTQASYSYLPNGLRSSKTVGGITTGQVWDGQNLIFETNSNGDVSNFYEYGLDLVRNKTNSTYYNYNAHGDVVQLTNSEGTVVNDYTYDAFGNGSSTGSVSNPFRYCGEYRDNETGLIYLRNRYYNPSTGRFINEDPIRSGGNWYSYCDSNPVRYKDSLGKQYEEDDKFTKVKKNTIEGFMSSLKTNSIIIPYQAYKIADWAREKAIKYAEYYKYYNSSGDLITWDNKADALRHFSWNARMTRELGIANATAIANNHEEITWDVKKVNGGEICDLKFSSLMDLYNNSAGRYYADTYPDLDYDQLWQKAMKDGKIITSLEQVQTVYGLSDNQVFSKDDSNNLSSKYVKFFIPDEVYKESYFLTKEEYDKYCN